MLDRNDRCPAEAGPRANAGCPDGDGDGDGLVDRLDDCPGMRGPVRFGGCPPPDADGDGVADPVDRCPAAVEVWNGVRDGDGCPDEGAPLVTIQDGGVVLAVPVLGPGERALTPAGRAAVRVAAAALAALHAERVHVVVVAEHGASYGDSAMRARARAAIVRTALVDATGLAPDRVTAAPRGPDGRPRIELVIRGAGPGGDGRASRGSDTHR